MVDTLRSYGVREQEAAGTDLAAHAERIRLAGCSVLEGAFSDRDTADFGARLDEILRRQAEEFGSDRLEQIGDGFTARCPLVDDAAFLRLATHPPLLELVRLLVGDFIVLMQQNGVINPPKEGHTQAAYHRDLPYQHFVSSRPLAISALFCIDPFRVKRARRSHPRIAPRQRFPRRRRRVAQASVNARPAPSWCSIRCCFIARGQSLRPAAAGGEQCLHRSIIARRFRCRRR
jgi:hypothetical protein